MGHFITLLIVALVSACSGAYLALLKGKKERLWSDRYETLREIVLALGTVESRFSSSHMELLGVSVISRAESNKLSEEWPVAMHTLRQNIAKLRLLFKYTDISAFHEAVVELNSAFTDVYHGNPVDMPEHHEAIAIKAKAAAEAAIAIGQKHCL
ncbi:hypothetical protein [Pectobacterium actinidiae]|uniref:hypothetical protein n=1 Tax=Pectobacterium actinidiae TaxID=1507808 RepID=UPI00207DF1F7|nr:hypothetical protein SOASR014_39540 [Pectobacterium carotovorum subsp. carotovorum]GLX43820.1 hypothetical protein Pcaca01_14880 [Pectobacterium carotovorum subsp. carotovorum]